MYSLNQKHCLVISSHLSDNNKINFEIMYSFNTAARGYHYYRRYWQLEFHHMLYLSHEKKKTIISIRLQQKCATHEAILLDTSLWKFRV